MDLESGFSIAQREVVPLEGRVRGPGGVVHVEPKAMQVLLELARHAPAVRSRAQIEQAVWPRGFVSEDVLTRCIGQLRRALGDDTRPPALLETIPKRGYRLRVAPEAAAPVLEPGLPVFVGRSAELDELAGALAPPGARLVSIVGPGGMGKSRLARQALAQLAAPFAQRAAWLDVQDLAEPAAVVARLAQQLGVALEETGDAVEQLGRSLASRPWLVALDNAEHLRGLPALVEALLAAAPALSLLVTSRRRLGLAQERVLVLGGLALPGQDPAGTDGAAGSDGVKLFAARARAAQPGFDLAPHLDAVVTLVRATDGMPLAIELAAAWVRLLPPEAIARELEGSIDVLERDETAPAPLARPEHGSVRMVLERSWQWLGEREREALSALAVFRGGFTASAARAVAGAPMPVVATLADRGLLTLDAGGRFGMHALVQADAAARLGLDPAREAALRAAHAQHYARALAQLADRPTADHGPVVAGLEADFANAEAAWRAAIDTAATGLLHEALEAWRVYFDVRGRSTQGLAHFQAALPAAGGDDRLRARLHAALSRLYFRKGDFASGAAIAQAGIECAERSGERRALAACLAGAGNCETAQGRWHEAGPYFERALAIGRADGAIVEVASALSNLGVVAKKAGRYEEALSCYEQALAIEREQEHHAAVARLLNNMAGLHMERNAWAAARVLMAQGVQLCERHGLEAQRPYLEFGLGAALLELGCLDAAAHHLQQALERGRAAEVAMIALFAQANLARLAARQGQAQQARRALCHVADEAQARDWGGLVLHVALFRGEALAAEGRRIEAARVWQAVLDAGEAEAGVRDSAARWLAALPLTAPERAEAARERPGLAAVIDGLRAAAS